MQWENDQTLHAICGIVTSRPIPQSLHCSLISKREQPSMIPVVGMQYSPRTSRNMASFVGGQATLCPSLLLMGRALKKYSRRMRSTSKNVGVTCFSPTRRGPGQSFTPSFPTFRILPRFGSCSMRTGYIPNNRHRISTASEKSFRLAGSSGLRDQNIPVKTMLRGICLTNRVGAKRSFSGGRE